MVIIHCVYKWLFKKNKNKKSIENIENNEDDKDVTDIEEDEDVEDDKDMEELESILSKTQLTAINKINKLCKQKHKAVIDKLNKYTIGENVDKFKSKFIESPIAINFDIKHLPKIAIDTHYRNQFETKTSGGWNSNPDRIVWESGLFSNAYGSSKDNGFDRPKYGNLMIYEHGYNMCNGYGQLYFILKDNVKKRTTFTLGDSGNNKFSSNNVYSFKHAITSYEMMTGDDDPAQKLYQYEYIELQIHGPIRLDEDVESLYLPECFKKSESKYVDKLIKKGIKIHYY